MEPGTDHFQGLILIFLFILIFNNFVLSVECHLLIIDNLISDMSCYILSVMRQTTACGSAGIVYFLLGNCLSLLKIKKYSGWCLGVE